MFMLMCIQYDERIVATTFFMMNSKLTKSLLVVSFCFLQDNISLTCGVFLTALCT